MEQNGLYSLAMRTVVYLLMLISLWFGTGVDPVRPLELSLIRRTTQNVQQHKTSDSTPETALQR